MTPKHTGVAKVLHEALIKAFREQAEFNYVSDIGLGEFCLDGNFDLEKVAASLESGCIGELAECVRLAQKALEHDVPVSCWSTGPMTGTIADALCPGCAALKKIEQALAKFEVKK